MLGMGHDGPKWFSRRHASGGGPACKAGRDSRSDRRPHRGRHLGMVLDPLLGEADHPHLIHSMIARTDAGVEKIVTVNRMAILGCINMIRANLDKSDEE